MATAYTSLLGLALPVTGELSGTWGDVVNNYLTSYVDASVAGSQTISGSQTSVTLSTTNGSALTQAGGAGTTGSSQYFIINCTGNPSGTLTITAPASSKSYIVINSTSTSQSVVLRGAGPTTGVTVVSGDKALVAWNGTDFVRVGASAGGSNTQIQYNNGGNLAGSANLTFDGSNVQIGSQGDLRFGDADNSNWVAFQAPATVASNITWTLPNADGSTGQVLSTNGSGALSWVAAGGSGSYTRTSFTATGGQTTFTVSYTVGYVEVFLNGVLLNASDYTASNGTSIVLASGAASGDILETIAWNIVSVGTVAIGNITGATANGALYANGSGTVTSGTLPVGSGGTGQTTYTDGQLLIGNSTGNTLTKATLTQGTGVTITNGSGAITIAIPQSVGTSSSVQFGSFGVGTAASGTTGEIRATNNITAYYSSDIKFKTNVRDIPNALATVNSIGGKLFDWTDEYINEHGGADGYFVQKEDFGVIAQDVQKVFPVAVRTRADGSLAVDYEKLGALAFAALCELTKRVEALEAK